jgi:hypothetical protein
MGVCAPRSSFSNLTSLRPFTPRATPAITQVTALYLHPQDVPGRIYNK